jgi:hypothetical protein
MSGLGGCADGPMHFEYMQMATERGPRSWGSRLRPGVRSLLDSHGVILGRTRRDEVMSQVQTQLWELLQVQVRCSRLGCFLFCF